MSVINTNLQSLQAQDSLNINNRKLSQAMQRLSTGSRINSAADDAAGLSISSRMDSQVRGLNMAIKNANDGMSLVQTAEGAMDEVTNILQRMRELAVQSASDTNSAEDRTNMNMEVEQLSSEIDRIAGTTQFNNMNILDGSFAGKVFQIGANANQTMGLSIGSMNSRVLGVATSTTTMASATPGTNPAGEVNGVVAQGVAPEETVVKLEFQSSGSYQFALKDSVTGLEMGTADMGSLSVDLTSQLSKDYFVEQINEKLRDVQGNTTVTGSRIFASTTTIDLTDSANLQKTKFSVLVDGERVDVDLSQALLSGGAGYSADGITRANVVAKAQEALRLAFDDNLSVSATTSNMLKIEDEQGRRIEVLQGAGDGFLFGTDIENGGGLLSRETARNPLSVAWDGDSNNLLVTNSMGGKISLSGFSSNTSGVLFNVVNDSQVDGLFEPQWLSQVAGNSAPSMSAVTFNGNVEPSALTLRFSDLVGSSANATTAMYTFKLTNGAGDSYGTFSVNMSQNLTDREDTIAAHLKTQISAAITTLTAAGDNTFDKDEFEITVAGDTIQIRNNAGRALAVEDFASDVGYMLVTPMNEPGSSEVLASKNAYYSENRIKVNAGSFGGLDFSTAGSAAFQITVNGLAGSANLSLTLNGTGALADGSALAAAIQTQIQGATVHPIIAGVQNTSVTEVLTGVKVAWDAENSEIVIRDDKGRSVGFGWAGSAQGGAVFLQNFNVGNSNQGLTTKLNSQKAQGDVYEATRVTMNLDSPMAGFNFKLNGTQLHTSEVLWDSTEPFAGSDLKTKLDAMMVALNADHPRTVFEYSVNGSSITFLQRDGGPLEFSNYTTHDNYPDVKASLTPADGQGDPITLSYVGHNTVAAATAAGTLAVTTSATLNLEGDDIYSLTVSDGTKSYSLSSTVLDISDNDSVNTFLKKLENTLEGSNIKASMDTNGNVYFSRADGGKLVLESFASATGRRGTWTPGAGQGEAVALAGSGAVSGTAASGTGASASTGGISVKQISVATQDGATKALSVIDKAISYVNTERSKLGAVVNRLTHTVDNLANIVTNTEASRSRIKDTDYASETAELARTQIIQQAATAMLAQANQAPQSVLALLR